MSDTIFKTVALTAINVGLWLVILSKRARRGVVKAWIRGNWLASKVTKEDLRTAELLVFCLSLVAALAFALLTVAVAKEIISS